MTQVNTHVTTGQPSHAGGAASAAPAVVVTPKASSVREITAASVDALTAEVLMQSNANPAACLEAPPPSSAESTAAASSSLTSLSTADSDMSVEALMDLMNKLILQMNELKRKNALDSRERALGLAEKLQFESAATTRESASSMKKEMAVKAAGELLGGVAQGSATMSARGSVEKGAFQMGGGAIGAASTLGQSVFKAEQTRLDADIKEQSALATNAQKVAETTAYEGVSSANDQIRAAQDSIRNTEDKRHESLKSIQRL